MTATLPQVPYGAVYFRKTNPPRGDWERDYQTAAQDGINVFRHWFLWGSIETRPGYYDWADYDRQMELAASNGIKTIVAELTKSVPIWACHQYEHALQVNTGGSRVTPGIGASTLTAGFGGSNVLCLDCGEVLEKAGDFLRALASRYKDHPSMIGYDIWNECNYSAAVCHCEHTKRKFRHWLARKYGSLDELNNAWHRYSQTEWEQVQPPKQVAPYPECLDWLQFTKENFYEQMQWKIDTIRSVDSSNYITAHGVAGAITNMADKGCDEWLAASKVQVYGFTWVAGRKGTEPWKQWHAVDLVRSGARGKPFWHAEAQGGPLWLQPQVIGREKEDGRVTEPEDVRLWNMTSFAGGAKGILYPRWRPLLQGPLFGAFGSYGMDGSRTGRSDMGSRIAKWANEPEQRGLFQSSPVKGEIGIVVVPETQQFDYLLNHESGFKLYAQCMWGAYRAFFDQNIQADWVHIDDLDSYEVLYFPYPIMLTSDQAAKLANWVEQGGTLISEGCPGYFGDQGMAGTVQPNLGLDRLFGAIQEDVEFMPDIGDRIRFEWDSRTLRGGVFLQSYRPQGGTARGAYADGRTAVIEHHYGQGKTLLVGTFPSGAYYKNQDESVRAYFAHVLNWSGKLRHIVCSNPHIQARIHDGAGGRYVWIVNSSREDQTASLTFAPAYGEAAVVRTLWGEPPEETGNTLTVKVPGRDVVIVQLGS